MKIETVQNRAFCLAHGAAPVACVDIGGTKVAVSMADERGLRAQVVEPTAKSGHNGLWQTKS